MTLLDEINDSYTTAATASVYVIHTEPGLVSDIAYSCDVFRRQLLGDEDIVGPVADIAQQLRNARYRLATNILPFDHPALELMDIAGLIEAAAALLPADSETEHEARRAVVALTSLSEGGTNPLGDHARELLADVSPDQRQVVLRHTHQLQATEQHLKERGVASAVVVAAQLGHQPMRETSICIGPTSFFPEATWTSARSETVCFVHYPFGWKAPSIGGLFGAQGGLQTPKIRESGNAQLNTQIEAFSISEAIHDAATQVARRSTFTGGSEIEAFMFLLARGYAVWTETDHRNQMLCVDADNADEPVIVRKPAAAIGPSDHLLLRSGNSNSDYVRELADRRYGAAHHRHAQARWKRALSQRVVEFGGLPRASRELRDLGATSTNLRYWLAPRCIHPKRQNDFATICALVGLVEETDELWRSLNKIRTAHLRAGQRIRTLLERRLLEDGVHDLKRLGYQEYQLDDLGHLAAYAVVHRHPDKAFISAGRIDEPFLAEVNGWPA